jgi:hypothetical protein
METDDKHPKPSELIPDPYGVFQSCADYESGEPGSLIGLYNSVVSAYEKGDYNEVPPDIVLLLLKGMGLPKRTDKQNDQIEVLRHIEVYQIFSKVGNPDAPDSFRAACFAYFDQLKGSNHDHLNLYARSLRVKIMGKDADPEQAYRELSALKTTRKIK